MRIAAIKFLTILLLSACGVSAGNPGGRGKLIVEKTTPSTDEDLGDEKPVVWVDKRFPRGVRQGDQIHLFGDNLGSTGKAYLGEQESEILSWSEKEVVIAAPSGGENACRQVRLEDIHASLPRGKVTDAVSNRVSIISGNDREWLPADDVLPVSGEAIWTGKEMIIVSARTGLGSRYNPATDSWLAMNPTNASLGTHAQLVWTGKEVIAVASNPAAYNPTSDSWENLPASGRPALDGSLQSAVWTGTEVIVWGQVSDQHGTRSVGVRYAPSTTTYRKMTAFHGSSKHAAVWTGTEMIVWGGFDIEKSDAMTLVLPPSGGRYSPDTDKWAPITTTDSPDPQRRDPAIFWTGESVIVWGGRGFGVEYVDGGGRYNPYSNTWHPISSDSAPINDGHSAVWTGHEMLLWNGKDDGRYDPKLDVWRTIATENSPAYRKGASAVWAGDEMIVWGGGGFSESIWGEPTLMKDGGRYSPTSDTWVAIRNVTDEPLDFFADSSAVWTGSEMIQWGGSDRSASGIWNNAVASGARYIPAENRWLPISDAPQKRYRHAAIWMHDAMVIWGGLDVQAKCAQKCERTGGPAEGGLAYSPLTNSWEVLPAPSSLTGTSNPHLLKTENGFLVWGGTRGGYWEDVTNGATYDRHTGEWRPMSLVGAPKLVSHVADLVDGDLFVWGKRLDLNGNWQSAGSLYSNELDVWTPISSLSGPKPVPQVGAAVAGKVVVWSYQRECCTSMNTTTHVYDPGTDAWQESTTPFIPGSEPVVFSDGERLIATYLAGDGSAIPNTVSLAGAEFSPTAGEWSKPSKSCYRLNTPWNRPLAVWTGENLMQWVPRFGVHTYSP